MPYPSSRSAAIRFHTAARVEGYDLEPTATLADGVVEVRAPEFVAAMEA